MSWKSEGRRVQGWVGRLGAEGKSGLTQIDSNNSLFDYGLSVHPISSSAT